MPAPDLFEWATDADYDAPGEPYDGEPTKVEPSDGQVEQGFRPDQRPTAENFNWLLNLIGQWIAWLSAGDIELGDVTVDSLHANNGITTDENVEAAGDVVAGEHVRFSGIETLIVPPTMFFQEVPAHSPAHNQWILAANSTPVYVPISLPVGALIVGWRIKVNKETSDSSEIQAVAVENEDGVDTDVGDSFSSDGDSPGVITLGVSGQTIPIVSGRTYQLRFDPSGDDTPDSDRLYTAEIDWSFPPVLPP